MRCPLMTHQNGTAGKNFEANCTVFNCLLHRHDSKCVVIRTELTTKLPEVHKEKSGSACDLKGWAPTARLYEPQRSSVLIKPHQLTNLATCLNTCRISSSI